MGSRALLLGALGVLTLLAGVTGIRPAYALAYGLVFTLLAAWIWSSSVSRQVHVRRDSPAGWSYAAGATFSEEFTIRNRGVFPVPYCEVRDRSTIGEYAPGRVCALRGGDVVRWTARGVFTLRGRHTLGPLEVRLGDPFGLFPRTLRVAPARSVIVHPQLHRIDDLGTVWSDGGPSGGFGRGRYVDAPPDVATVREYRPEDGFGRIHWRSTARTGRLMSRTYDTSTSADLLVVLDLQTGTHAGVGPESSLEYAVSLAASVCHAALGRGQTVGLVTNDAAGTMFPAGRGEIHRLRILDHLAVATDDGTRPLAETIRHHGARPHGRGALVVLTASHDPGWVGALLDAGVRGRRHLAILVDPVSFGAAGPGFRPPRAWRAALDWWVVLRGDSLTASRPARSGTF